MRILYGVQATGNGHITRARTMLPALQQAGIKVDFLFSGRKRAALFDMEAFGDFHTKTGFTFITQAGQVRIPDTLTSIKPVTFLRDVHALDVSAYDYVVTDFEPVSAWAAKRQHKTVIGLAHQYALCHRLPGTERAFWLPAALKAFAPATYLLGIHWHHFHQPILPPLIAISVPKMIEDHDFVLVYLPFEDLSAVMDWLQAMNNTRFRVYAAVQQAEDYGHIQIHPLSRTTFPQDLACCSGIITNSGFGLCSEALMLGKKILTKPLRRQIEQFSNAQILRNMRRAVIMSDFNHHVLRQWLEMPSFTPVVYPDVAAVVTAWLKSGCTETPQQLCDRLWQQVSHP